MSRTGESPILREEMKRTSGGTPHYHAADTFIYPTQPPCARKTLRRLQTSLDGIDWEE